MLEPSDVLILDEPTNDLDIPTLEIMEEALEDYPGSLVLVTHDRAMLGRLATGVLMLDGFGASEHYASLDQAIAAAEVAIARRRKVKKPSTQPESKQTAEAPKPAQSKRVKLSYNEQREYDRIEADIESAEQTAIEAEAAVSDPSVIKDHEAMARACSELETAQANVAKLYARWDELEAKRSGASV